MTLTLGARLAAAASFVRPGAVLADIGTDHAYLPARLLLDGTCRFAAASDLRPGPLENARRTAERYGVARRMTFLLGNGLEALDRRQGRRGTGGRRALWDCFAHGNHHCNGGRGRPRGSGAEALQEQ